MSYRGNPQQKFGGPSPWLQGCPPNMRSPCLPLNSGPGVAMSIQGRAMGANPAINQNFGNNLVNQLALANSLLSNAFSPKTQNFGNQCGSLLGSPPINFNIPNRIMGGNMMGGNSNFQGPDAKRMRYSNQQNNRGGSYQQRNNRQQGRNNSNYKRNKNRDDSRNKKDDDKDRKHVEEKQKDKEEKINNEKGNSVVDLEKSEDTYDPASPTSDGGHIEPSNEENKDDRTKAGQKRPRSPSLQQKDNSKGTLQVTIQRGTQGRSVSKDGESGTGSSCHGPMFCHVCNVSCGSQENFHKHMNSKNHKLKMDSLITLHEAKTKQIEARMRGSEHLRSIEDKERGRQRGGGGYCNICKSHFTGTLIDHKRTKDHKRKKEHLYPFCRKCRIKHFQNRDEYEEHCKSEAHKKACEEWNRQRQDSDNAHSDSDEFEENDNEEENDSIAVADSTGGEGLLTEKKDLDDEHELAKPNGDQETKENMSQEENAENEKDLNLMDDAISEHSEVEEALDKNEQENVKIVSKDEQEEIPMYNPNQAIGQSHIIPLSGLFCKLCRKFYRDNNSAKVHCQSRMHYDNYMKALASKKNQKDQTKDEKEAASKMPKPTPTTSQLKAEKDETKENSSSSSNCKQDFSDERILSDIDEILGHTENTSLVHSNPSDNLCSEGDQLDDEDESDVIKTPPKASPVPKEVTKTPKKSSSRGRRGKGRGRRS